eukprot:jgi/Bigna1/87827/estExt_fgenesh1_pg.C_240191
MLFPSKLFKRSINLLKIPRNRPISQLTASLRRMHPSRRPSLPGLLFGLRNVFGVGIGLLGWSHVYACAQPEESINPGHRDLAKVKCQKGKPSVVIIGMRGAGKTTLRYTFIASLAEKMIGVAVVTYLDSAAAGSELGLSVIDVDTEIERYIGTNIKSFINSNGWKAFRDAENKVFMNILNEHPYGSVIACGGGIVVTPSNREVLKSHPRVVEIVRDIEDIVAYLELDKTRPAYAIQSTRDTYNERIPWLNECAGWHFVIARGDKNWKSTEQDFSALIRLVQNGRLTHSKFR